MSDNNNAPLSPQEFTIVSSAWKPKTIKQLVEDLGFDEEDLTEAVDDMVSKGLLRESQDNGSPTNVTAI